MRKIHLLIFGLILFGVISIPIISFALHFSDYTISDDPNEWSNFATYISGTTGTIISLASLILLSIISLAVHQLSTSENRANLISERKRSAYDDLAKYITTLNNVPRKISTSWNSINTFHNFQTTGEPNSISDNFIEVLENQIHEYINYHSTLFNFSARYGYLFSFNQYTTEYNETLESSNQCLTSLQTLQSDILNYNPLKPDELSNAFEIHSGHLIVFLEQLRSELTS